MAQGAAWPTAEDPGRRRDASGQDPRQRRVGALEDLDPALDVKMRLVNDVSRDDVDTPPTAPHPALLLTSFPSVAASPGADAWGAMMPTPWPGHRRDWLDTLPRQALLPQRLRVRVSALSAWTLAHPAALRYAVDSLILTFQSIVADRAHGEFGGRGFSNALTVALYIGMLAGAVFWGCAADIVGRKWAFNVTLLVCSASCVAAGAMPSWPTLGLMVAVLGFGGGGNLILDTAVFLEFLPGDKQWMLTMLACWWGLGQALAVLIGWVFLVPERWNCVRDRATTCASADNRGWRFVFYTGGGLVLVLSLLRITVVRLRETPKHQLAVGRDAEVVETLRLLAAKYRRPCSLTLEKLEAGGAACDEKRRLPATLWLHLSGLFGTRVMATTTLMLWLSWTLIGLAYPLFFVFLPCVPCP